MSRSTPDKNMPITTLVNLRLWNGQMQELEAFASRNKLKLDHVVSAFVSKGLEDLARESEAAILQDEEIEPPSDC